MAALTESWALALRRRVAPDDAERQTPPVPERPHGYYPRVYEPPAGAGPTPERSKKIDAFLVARGITTPDERRSAFSPPR